MSTVAKILLSIVLLLTTFSSTAVLKISRAFPTEVAPLSIDPLSANLWDFSRNWLFDDKGKTIVTNYGDTILTETIDGRRYRYHLRSDSLFYISEEDRLTAVQLDCAAFLTRFPVAAGFSGRSAPFSAKGTGGGRRFAITETGEIVYRTAPATGTLILAPGDTLYNVLAVSERRSFIATVHADSMSAVSALVETCRWYEADLPASSAALIPVAMQRKVYSLRPGESATSDLTPSVSVAYLPDLSEFRHKKRDSPKPGLPDLPDAGEVAAALAAATVTCDGRTVTVAFSMPTAGLTVTADIVDASGHLYLHDSSISADTPGNLSIDCSSLRSGEYIVVIGVEDMSLKPEKRLAVIH